MKIIKKSKVCISEDCYKEVVKTYLDFITEYLTDLNGAAVSELLRHTICLSLDLKSRAYDSLIEKLALDCSKIIKPIFEKYNVTKAPIEYRQAMLEACMHCIEIARKRA